jgi:hypothetical protein
VSHYITDAGNVLVPAFLAIEQLGFTVTLDYIDGQPFFVARSGADSYGSHDPIALLGLVKLVETRGWDWKPADTETERVLAQYDLDGRAAPPK